VRPELTFEFGPIAEKREFVISAAGIKDAFPVVALARAAPPLARRHIIRFRPRRDPTYTIQVGDDGIDPKDVQFSLVDSGRLAVFIGSSLD
jgi:hypothetical protein